MKYTLIISMGMFVASCSAAASSMSVPKHLPITLMHPVKTCVSSVNTARVQRHSGKTLLMHIQEDMPPVLARIRFCSASGPRVWLHRWYEGRNFRGNLAHYNETHKKGYQLDYYLVKQKDNGELVGLLLPGASYIGMNVADHNCKLIMHGQSVDAQVAAGNLCMEYKMHEEAVKWYKQSIVASSKIAQPVLWSTLHSMAKASFAAGTYEDAVTYGLQARHEAYGKSQSDSAVKIIFRAYVALQQWDKAIDIGAPLYAMLRDSDILCSSSPVINDLAYAYSRRGQLHEAFDCALDAVDEDDLADPDKELYIHAALNLLYYVARLRANANKDGSVCGFGNDTHSKLTACAMALKEFSAKNAWIKAYRLKYCGRYLVAAVEAQRYLPKQTPTLCQDDVAI